VLTVQTGKQQQQRPDPQQRTAATWTGVGGDGVVRHDDGRRSTVQAIGPTEIRV